MYSFTVAQRNAHGLVCTDNRSTYVFPKRLAKTQRGGVALRATFAALIALGSIPGAAVISSNFSPVAFAATRSSNDVPQGLAEKKAEVTRQIKALTNLDENAKKFYLDKVTNARTERDVDSAAFDASYADSRVALGNAISVANAMKHDVAYSSVIQGKKDTFEKNFDRLWRLIKTIMPTE